MLIACFVGGIVVVHILGSAWLGQVTSIGIKKAFLLGSAPFIPGDLIKAVVAVLIGRKLSKQIKKIYNIVKDIYFFILDFIIIFY